MIRIVTITVDNALKVEELFDLSEKYPFVEWRIPFSVDQEKGAVSYSWIGTFRERFFIHKERVLHIPAINLSPKGRLLKEILHGNKEVIEELFVTFPFFRLQLEDIGSYAPGFARELPAEGTIYVFSGAGAVVLAGDAYHAKLQNGILYQRKSLGDTGPELKPIIRPLGFGYEGYFRLEVLQKQMQDINEVVKNRVVWIDISSATLTTDGKVDMQKIKECLHIAHPLIQ